MTVRVQTDDFDVSAEIKQLTAGQLNTGAVTAFVGLVRELHPHVEAEQSMTLEHYPGMTERQLEKIEAEAAARWPLTGTAIVHRVGKLAAGAQIVLVLAASRHRQASFDAANFLMDYLKTQAPFWKLEQSGSTAGQWVDARDSDSEAMNKWR